jgi:ubiquitin carboxyl-terminal hydrolase 7
VLVPKTGTIEDLIQALVKKAQITDEAEGGRIRVYETNSNRFYREPQREHLVSNLNDYTQIYAERVPEEEQAADDNNFIQVFHFQNEVNRAHGVPFRFLLVEVSDGFGHISALVN